MIFMRKELVDESHVAIWFLEMLRELERITDTDFYAEDYKSENYWASGFECMNEKGLVYADVLEAIGYDPGPSKRVLNCRWNSTEDFSYRLYTVYDLSRQCSITIAEFDIVDDHVAIQARLCVN